MGPAMALATTSIGGTGMGCYGHPGIEGREDIMVHWGDHEGVSRIAREIGRDKSTVSREIARNGWAASTSPRRVYRASTAQARADARRLFQVVSEAYETQSAVFTANLEFSR